MDGEQKLATLTLVDAEAYDVSGNGSVAVTVVGSSDVPGALPTVSFLDSMLTLKEGAYGDASSAADGRVPRRAGHGDGLRGRRRCDRTFPERQCAGRRRRGQLLGESEQRRTHDLTVTSLSDRDLEDGSEASATLTISDGYGAVAGDNATLTVTVIGSTAVPALPLVGQLLLALFLMAGGARLYRRRNG